MNAVFPKLVVPGLFFIGVFDIVLAAKTDIDKPKDVSKWLNED